MIRRRCGRLYRMHPLDNPTWTALTTKQVQLAHGSALARRFPPDMTLLGALAVVVFGSLLSEYAGIYGWIREHWEWFGNQGWEYLDLGRFWQVLLSVGLVFWVVMLFRVLRERLRTEHPGNLPWLFFYAALAIPAFYAVGLLSQVTSHITVAEYWRWWVVHL